MNVHEPEDNGTLTKQHERLGSFENGFPFRRMFSTHQKLVGFGQRVVPKLEPVFGLKAHSALAPPEYSPKQHFTCCILLCFHHNDRKQIVCVRERDRDRQTDRPTDLERQRGEKEKRQKSSCFTVHRRKEIVSKKNLSLATAVCRNKNNTAFFSLRVFLLSLCAVFLEASGSREFCNYVTEVRLTCLLLGLY